MNLKAEFSSQIRIVSCCYSADRIPVLPWKYAFTSSFFAHIASSHNKKTWILSYNKYLVEVLSECHSNTKPKEVP